MRLQPVTVHRGAGSCQGDTAGTTEELQQEMALEAAPRCPYLASQPFCSWGHLSSGPTAHLSPSPDVPASSTEAPQTPNTKSCPRCCWGPSRDQVCQQGFYPNFTFLHSRGKESAFPSSMRNPILSASSGSLWGSQAMLHTC